MTLPYLIFYCVILLANIIQGITGFAGTILAMPVSMMTVGFEVARPVLNGLGILAGLMVLVTCYKKINWIEFTQIILVMATGIVIGMVIKHTLVGKGKILFIILGVFIIIIAVIGLIKMFVPMKKLEDKKEKMPKDARTITTLIADYGLLLGSGIIHGMFVSGGPLLIAYLTRKIKDKDTFRATISTVWILLNGIIFATDCINGVYTKPLLVTQAISIPFMCAGVVIGGFLYKHMSQKVFIILTYILLIISGISLIFK
ncbi:MAG: TSUP family transporter [Treponemataceae bacterium]|nr:TSUP family transporter [Treponemataceae bacterium]